MVSSSVIEQLHVRPISNTKRLKHFNAVINPSHAAIWKIHLNIIVIAVISRKFPFKRLPYEKQKIEKLIRITVVSVPHCLSLIAQDNVLLLNIAKVKSNLDYSKSYITEQLYANDSTIFRKVRTKFCQANDKW